MVDCRTIIPCPTSLRYSATVRPNNSRLFVMSTVAAIARITLVRSLLQFGVRSPIGE